MTTPLAAASEYAAHLVGASIGEAISHSTKALERGVNAILVVGSNLERGVNALERGVNALERGVNALERGVKAFEARKP